MEAERLASAATTRSAQARQIVEELIDHIIVSPGIWSSSGLFRIQPNSCRVESKAWEAHALADPDSARQDRPSDHKPVSAVIVWDD